MAYKQRVALPVNEGGSGATSLAGVLIGNGTAPFSGNTITQYNVLVAGASNSIISIAPGATSGVPLISQGASSNPAFGTATVPGGGTGNVLFTAYAPICGGTTASGALQSATSGISNVGYVLTSTGNSSLPTWQAASAGGINTIDGDTGSITGATTVTVSTVNGSLTSGKTFTTLASDSDDTLYISTSDTVGNTLIGDNAGNSLAGGENNTALGSGALFTINTGERNSAVGGFALTNINTANDNVALGYNAASAYTGAESNNIVIGANVLGTVAESNVIRIGETQTSCYIAGISNVTVSNKEFVTINTVTGQLGSDNVPGSVSWSVITADQTAVVNSGYICNKAGTLALSLPASSVVGDIIEVTGINTATGWRLTQASGQQIFFGATNTTLGSGGSLTSSATRDAIRIVCIAANTTWQVLSSIGNITVV